MTRPPPPTPTEAQPREILNIRSRVLVPLTLALLFLASLFVAKSLYTQRQHARDDVNRAAESVRRLYQSELNESAAQMRTLGEVIMRDTRLAESLRILDRRALLNKTKALFDNLRAQNRITHFYFHRPDGVCLLRVHHPEEYGDLVTRATLVQARAGGGITSGNEQGPNGTYTLRVVFPWVVDGQRIGYLELGKDFGDLLNSIRIQPDVEVLVSIDKQFLNRRLWEVASAKVSRKVEWDRYPSCVLINNSLGAVPEPIDAALSQPNGPELVPTQFTYGARTAQVIPVPLSDVQGRVLGHFFVVRDVTGSAAIARGTLWVTTGASMAVALALLGWFYRFLGRVQRDLTRATQNLRTAVAQRERADRELEHNRERMALLEQQSAMAAELERARQQAESANRAKSVFLANMSHEIRTPMTAILGYAELLADRAQTPKEREDCVRVIRRNGDHLLALINDILDLSRIESGKLTAECVPCPLTRVVDEVAAVMGPRAAEKGLAFAVEYQGELPQTIRTDPTRLRQILTNLVGNGIKFTAAGGVKLAVRTVDPTRQMGALIAFDVIDTGIGLTPAQCETLFQPFVQSDASVTRKFGGSGLGLIIARTLAAKLGGDVTVVSQPRQGSTFTATVDPGPLDGVPLLEHETPTTPGEPELQTVQALARPIEAKILVVEDGPDNQLLLEHHLKQAGAQVTLAENGAVAINHVLVAAAAGAPFDLILMDMQMPYMDGYTATAALRAQGYATPIVALTAHAMPEDRAKCLQAGCSDYLSKPVERQMLLTTVRRHLRERGPVPHAA